MLDNKILQQIRDKILGVTGGVHGDLNSTVYLQQIRDAILGVSGLIPGSMHEIVYLQQIRNAILGVPDGQFGSMPASIYLQEILNAYNGVTAQPNGNLDDGVYLDAIALVATGGDTTEPTVAITCAQSSPSAESPLNFTATLSEPSTDFTIDSFTVGGGTKGNFAGSGTVFTCDVTPTGDSAVTVDVLANAFHDAAGNGNTAATQLVIDIYGPEQTLTIQPDGTAGIDNWLRDNSPNANNGIDTSLVVGYMTGLGRTCRTLIDFTSLYASIPDNALITSDIFTLFAISDYSSNARTFRVYRMKHAWTETGSTWNKSNGTDNWLSGAGAFGVNDCEQIEIGHRDFSDSETLLGAAKDFVLNPTTKAELGLYGRLIKADVESDDAYTFGSSEDTNAARRPKEVIKYRVPL